MEIATDLKSVLNDNEEPLTKRLKIAQNALYSVELIGINKEEILLEWFSLISPKTKNDQVWEALNLCLNSTQLQSFRQSKINDDIISKLIKSLSKCLKENKESDCVAYIVRCCKSVLKNTAFKQFFKHNVKLYCKFIATVLKSVSEINEINSILNDKDIFDLKIFVKTDCCIYFVTNTFLSLFEIVLEFNDESITNNIIKLIQRCVIQHNQKDFENYIENIFDEMDNDINAFSSIFMIELSNFYNLELDVSQISFKIIFKIFFETYKTQHFILYKFFVLILQILGIENSFSDIKVPNINIDPDNNKSLAILSDVFEVIGITPKFPEVRLNEVKFNDCIKQILTSLLKSPELNSSVLNIFKTTIIISPLIIENLTSEIILKILLSPKNDLVLISYGTFMISVFEMYLKLHRIDNFTSEILRTFKNSFNDDKIICTNVNDIFPESVLNYYQYCVMQQSGTQIISIMRTFTGHLQEVVDNLQDFSTNDKKKLYVQALTELFCHFLSVVRIAEYNTTQITISKFCKDLDEMKAILRKFGSSLLNMEHDQPLMNCFLMLSESWAELVIILKCYSTAPNGSQLKDISPINNFGDYTACYLTYIHTFLSAKQWSNVAQRIKNFGDKPCEDIMHKLMFQKVRAFFILDSSEKMDIDETTILKNALLHLGDNWDVLLKENTSLLLLLHEDVEIVYKIADFIIKEYIDSDNTSLLKQQSVVCNKRLVISLLYIWFSKISDLFKIKRKHNGTLTTNPALVSKIYKSIDINMLINEEINYEDMEKFFVDIDVINIKIDELKLMKSLKMVKFLPVWGLPKNVQKIFFVFLLGLRVDMSNNDFHNTDCVMICENYLRGMIDSPWSPNLFTIFSSKLLIQLFMNHVKNSDDILMLLFSKSMKYNETIPNLPKLKDFKSYEDDFILKIGAKILQAISKTNKIKLTNKNKVLLKTYKEELCKNLCKKLLKDDNISNEKIENYVLLVQYYIQIDGSKNLMKLISIHEKYVDFCIENINDINQETALKLFEVLLRNKLKITLENDFSSKTWTLCTKVKNIKEPCFKHLSQTVSLIFEYKTKEEFSKTLNEFLALTIIPLMQNNFDVLNNNLKIWHCLINSALSTQKQEIFFKLVVKLFQNIMIYLIKNNDENFDEAVVKMELDMINNNKIMPSANMIDIYLQTISILMSRSYNFTRKYNWSISLMTALIKTRKYLIIDRLPSYLSNVRTILNELCIISHTEDKANNPTDKNILDCAFQFEKLIRKICYLKRDMVRIGPYLVGDIIKKYEKTIFMPGVKNYLDSSIFLLLENCDQYAVSYLFRVLSPASTELFKNIYDNYQKYHKFTGRI